VIAYVDLPGVKDFFARFNVSTEPTTQLPLASKYIDFSTGLPVTNYPSANQTAALAALAKYGQITAPYVPQIFPGYFNLSDQVPEDLALPFGEFLAKYSLQAMLPIIWPFISAADDLLTAPTLFAIQNFGPIQLRGLQQPGGFFIPSSHNNSQLYGAVQQYLAADLLLSSTVSQSNRDDSGVRLVVNTPSGQKLIKAKKLLVTAAPTVDNLDKLDLDSVEVGVFGKWEWSSSYVGVVSHTGMPDGLDVINALSDSSPTTLNLPKAPFVAEYKFTGVPGLYSTTVIGKPGLSEHQAKDLVRNGFNKIGDAGTLPTKNISFEAFCNHTPLQLRVSAEELKAGFYKKLYALQGRRSTFYTGAAWTSDVTSTLWVFTEQGILPQILAGV
jgi:hypothetical protein